MSKQIKDFPRYIDFKDDDLLLLWNSTDSATQSVRLADLKAYLGTSTSTNTTSSTTIKNLTYASDGDSNGVFYWLGTNYGNQNWTNPHTAGRIIVSLSQAYDANNNNPDALVNRNFPDGAATNNDPNAYIEIDLIQNRLKPNYCSIRSNTYSPSKLQFLQIIASSDRVNWDVLSTETNHTNFNQDEWFSVAMNSSNYYRYLRIRQTGATTKNDYIIALSEIEFYGSFMY